MGRLINRIGQRYGKLVVLEKSKKKAIRCAFWKCRCDCGKEIILPSESLATGNTKSCGCGLKAWRRSGICNSKHRMYKTPEYSVWDAMKQRCRNKNHPCYHRYGGRGISVCKRWDDFENFLYDMGKRPHPKLSIERRDNDGNYEPSNCYWANQSEQIYNQERWIKRRKNRESIA